MWGVLSPISLFLLSKDLFEDEMEQFELCPEDMDGREVFEDIKSL